MLSDIIGLIVTDDTTHPDSAFIRVRVRNGAMPGGSGRGDYVLAVEAKWQT